MKISVVAQTMDEKALYDLLDEAEKENCTNFTKKCFDRLGGKAAGICYMPHDWDTLNNENEEKSLRRSQMTKESGHHSTHSHAHISLIIENCSKMFAMLINNEHEYTTSEKSARYTKMITDGKTKELYEKWTNIFKEILDGSQHTLDQKKKIKLAMENARYLISVFNPSTVMLYTTSYRQLNYLYWWSKDIVDNKINYNINDTKFYNQLKKELKSFCEEIESLDLVDPALRDDKNRTFSLINNVPTEEHFGTSYETSYLASFAALAQLQRHRSVYYNFSFTYNDEYYIPPMIRDSEELVEEWIHDMKSLDNGNYPQGKILLVHERGTKEMAVLKAKERMCTNVQKEANDLTTQLMKDYYYATKDSLLSFYDDIKKIAETGFKSRCMWGYKCTSPCKNLDGIKNSRDY